MRSIVTALPLLFASPAPAAEPSPAEWTVRFLAATSQRPAGIPLKSYVPGTVSLEEVARKYPSLYPDVNFTSGRL